MDSFLLPSRAILRRGVDGGLLPTARFIGGGQIGGECTVLYSTVKEMRGAEEESDTAEGKGPLHCTVAYSTIVQYSTVLYSTVLQPFNSVCRMPPEPLCCTVQYSSGSRKAFNASCIISVVQTCNEPQIAYIPVQPTAFEPTVLHSKPYCTVQ